MAGDEEKPQQVIAYLVVESRIKIWHGHLFRTKLASKLLVLALKQRVSAEVIDGTMLGCGHQPSTGIGRDARLGPLLECGDQSILCQILGKTDITYDAYEPSDEPG